MRRMNLGWIVQTGMTQIGNTQGTNILIKSIYTNFTQFIGNNGLIVSGNTQINTALAGICNIAGGSFKIFGRNTDTAANSVNADSLSIQLNGSIGTLNVNTALQRIIITSPAGSFNGNTWGGYTEWDTATATITNPSANQVIYTWSGLGNTNLPFQFNTQSGLNIAGTQVIYVY